MQYAFKNFIPFKFCVQFFHQKETFVHKFHEYFYNSTVRVIGDAVVEVVEGFMIQARDRTTAEALGTFDAVDGKVKVIDCFGNNTQVHRFKQIKLIFLNTIFHRTAPLTPFTRQLRAFPSRGTPLKIALWKISTLCKFLLRIFFT